VLLVLLALFADQLVVVLRRDTLTAREQTLLEESPPLTLVTTQRQDPGRQPFMIAVDLHSGNPEVNLSNPSFSIQTYTNTIMRAADQSWVSTNTSFQLEPCSVAHFAEIPGIEAKFGRWGAGEWLCLPLGATF
jgi:hypothetical protein